MGFLFMFSLRERTKPLLSPEESTPNGCVNHLSIQLSLGKLSVPEALEIVQNLAKNVNQYNGFPGPCPPPCCESTGLFNGPFGYSPCSCLEGNPLCSLIERTHDYLAKGRPQQYPGDSCAVSTEGGVAEGLWESWTVWSQGTIWKAELTLLFYHVTRRYASDRAQSQAVNS